MVLTESQKKQLNRDILEYMANNQYVKAAQVFAQLIEINLADIDPEGNKLEVKWKSILALQKKINLLDEKVHSLEEDLKKALAHGGAQSTSASLPNQEDLYIPKVPPKYNLKGHKSNITFLAFHPQYTQLASASEDGTVKLWQFDTGDFERTLKGHTNPVNCVAYDPQGRLIASCSSDLTIKLWDIASDYPCIRTLNGHDHNVSCIMFMQDGQSLVSCSRDQTVKLWQVNTGFCKRTFVGHEDWVRTLTISNDGKLIISGSNDQTVIVWNPEKETPVIRYVAHDHVIQALLLVEGEASGKLTNAEFLKNKFSAESRVQALKQLSEQGANGITNYYQPLLFTAGRDKLIKLFVCMTGQLLHTFIGHDNWVRSLSLHVSGSWLYSSSDDKTIRVWDLSFGKEKKKVDAAHEHFVSSVRYNGKYGVLASSGNDQVIKIWTMK